MGNNDSGDYTYYALFEDIKIHVEFIMPHKICHKQNWKISNNIFS